MSSTRVSVSMPEAEGDVGGRVTTLREFGAWIGRQSATATAELGVPVEAY